MLTAYHVSLPHACCPFLWWRVASGHSAIIMRLCGLRYTCVHGVMISFSYATTALGPEVWEYENMTRLGYHSSTRECHVSASPCRGNIFTTSHASPIQHNSITAYLISFLTKLYYMCLMASGQQLHSQALSTQRPIRSRNQPASMRRSVRPLASASQSASLASCRSMS